jgi:hypothetical protein
VDLPFARWRRLDWFALGLVLLAVWRPRFVIVVTRVELGLVRASPARLYAVHRDRLNIAHYSGYSADVRYGLYLSLALMSALLLVILTESVRWRVPELPWLSG